MKKGIIICTVIALVIVVTCSAGCFDIRGLSFNGDVETIFNNLGDPIIGTWKFGSSGATAETTFKTDGFVTTKYDALFIGSGDLDGRWENLGNNRYHIKYYNSILTNGDEIWIYHPDEGILTAGSSILVRK